MPHSEIQTPAPRLPQFPTLIRARECFKPSLSPNYPLDQRCKSLHERLLARRFAPSPPHSCSPLQKSQNLQKRCLTPSSTSFVAVSLFAANFESPPSRSPTIAASPHPRSSRRRKKSNATTTDSSPSTR